MKKYFLFLFLLASSFPSAKGSNWISSNPETNQGKFSFSYVQPREELDPQALVSFSFHSHLEGNSSWGLMAGFSGKKTDESWGFSERPVDFIYRSKYKKENKIASGDWLIKFGIPVKDDDSMSWGIGSRNGGVEDGFIFTGPFYWGLGFLYESYVDNPNIEHLWNAGIEAVWEKQYDYGLRLEHIAQIPSLSPRQAALDWSFWIRAGNNTSWKSFSVTWRDEATNMDLETLYEFSMGWGD
tara:strand:- start:3338 stop:4057 length:720 start_codon:yes stop_codon:yes gene_type:complete